MRDDELLRALDITLAEAKELYSVLSAAEGASMDSCASIKAKLEERLYDVLTLEEMAALARSGTQGK
jgi:hypothetical protein